MTAEGEVPPALTETPLQPAKKMILLSMVLPIFPLFMEHYKKNLSAVIDRRYKERT